MDIICSLHNSDSFIYCFYCKKAYCFKCNQGNLICEKMNHKNYILDYQTYKEGFCELHMKKLIKICLACNKEYCITCTLESLDCKKKDHNEFCLKYEDYKNLTKRVNPNLKFKEDPIFRESFNKLKDSLNTIKQMQVEKDRY